jgi:hypothetical protein
MAISLRETASARLMRFSYHAVVGAAAALATWSAVSALGRSKAAGAELAAAREQLEEHRVSADALAAECGIRPFSDEGSLETFPMQLPAFPTKRENECARKVGVARADLIQDHFRLKTATADEAKKTTAARRRVPVAAVLAVILAAGIYLAEMRPRSRTARRTAGA